MDEESFDETVRRFEATNALRTVSTAEDIAAAALFLVGDDSRHMTGELMRVHAGMHLGVSALR